MDSPTFGPIQSEKRPADGVMGPPPIPIPWAGSQRSPSPVLGSWQSRQSLPISATERDLKTPPLLSSSSQNNSSSIPKMGPYPSSSDNLMPPPSPPLSAHQKEFNSPFNFTSTTLMPPSPAKPSHRRGHKYKHSSISVNFFQEPPKRAPLSIPASLPIPTLIECYQSMSHEQRVRLGWCFCHVAISLAVYASSDSAPFTALAALAHLLLYDAVCAALCVSVDIVSNFEVWRQSSIHHPFGLGRVEVLVGFALCVSLIFMGADIISHTLQDMAEFIYVGSDGGSSHSSGHSHSHGHGSRNADGTEAFEMSSVVFRVILGLVSTIVSSIGLDNHSRIGRALRFGGGAGSLDASGAFDIDGTDSRSTLSTKVTSGFLSLASIYTINPTHVMTMTFSVAVLLFPLAGHAELLDSLLTPLIGLSMCYIGWNLAKALGGMLVMSFTGTDNIDDIIHGVKAISPSLIETVSDVAVWQVHHGLWLASLKIVMSGTDGDERRVRERAATVIKDCMGVSVDGVSTWETTIDITRTTLD